MAAPAKAPSRPAPAPEPNAEGGGKLRWVLGWIVLPGTIIAALFLSGVHVGARAPERGLPRLLLKVFGGEPGVATEAESSVPSMQQGEPFSISTVVPPERLAVLAKYHEKFGGVDELECKHVCPWFIAEYADRPVGYTIEHCEFSPTVSWAPSMLRCSGKLDPIGTAKEPAR
jgi:hypothetical protein